MKRVGISIFNLQEQFGDFRAIEIAKEIGADCVDFSLCGFDVANGESVYARGEDEVRAYFRRLKEYADKLGIGIEQTHGRITGVKKDEKFNADFIKSAKMDCIATKELGAKYCVMHAITSMVFGADAPDELMYSVNNKMFADILPFAVKEDIIIATETFGDAPGLGCNEFFGDMTHFINSYEKLANVPEFSKHFCICMDTGHTHRSTRFEGNPKVGDVIRKMGGAIKVLHLHDNDGYKDQHKIPMTGTLDWKDTISALCEIGYDGAYNLEVLLTHFGKDFMIEEARFAVKVMRQILSTY